MRTARPVAVAVCAVAFAGVMRPQQRQASAPGLQALNEGRGTPLVMLGGGTLGAAEFAPHARVLGDDYRVIRLETINVEAALSRAALPERYTLGSESAAMARTLDRLRLDAPIDLVGHSYGGLVALDYALDHPHRIRTLVLAEPPAFWLVPAEERQRDGDLRAIIELTRELTPQHDPTDDQLVRFRCALGNCVSPPRAGDPRRQDWDRRRAALRGLAAVADHRDDPDRLRRFDRPVLILTGAQTVRFHRRIDDLLAAALPTVERADLPGGHDAPSAAPNAFVAALRAFFQRHRYD
jgi:pimeloyl-ACP methyl ester carboxylesterase